MASGNAQVSVAPPTNAASQAPESVPRRSEATAPESFDLARLERAVRTLVADQKALRQENADLYGQLRTATTLCPTRISPSSKKISERVNLFCRPAALP